MEDLEAKMLKPSPGAGVGTGTGPFFVNYIVNYSRLSYRLPGFMPFSNIAWFIWWQNLN